MQTVLERVSAYINDEEQITPEQRAAITSPARIAVVRACPGSGKTRAFAARFAWDIVTTATPRHGVAALSFTNVAQQEVRNRVAALDVPAEHPHFVGTIDAFLLRFVVRRFGGTDVNLDRFSHPVADRDYTIQTASIRYGPENKHFARLSACRFGVDEKGVFRGEYVTDDHEVVVIPKEYQKALGDAKKKAWKDGELTHSDVVALALKLLRQPGVANIVAGRFPRILVDEFQDTTGVREYCLRELFNSPRFSRGLVVGDPDQCIMEFAGARPELFDEFEKLDGASHHKLTICFRSTPSIVKVTAALRDKSLEVEGRRVATASSETVLAVHDLTPRAAANKVAAIATTFRTICEERGILPEHAVVLAWKDKDVARLGGLTREHLPLSAPAFDHVLKALRDLACGRALEAFQRVERLIAQVVIGAARPPRKTELTDRGLDLRRWRRTVMQTLRNIATVVPDETVQEWAKRVRKEMESSCTALAGSAKSLGTRFPLKVDGGGAKKQGILASPVGRCLPDSTDVQTSPITKIHQVKGQEFRAVCLYVPADRTDAEPILLREQPPTADAMSTRRVLYVGATRAQDLLVVALPLAWVEALEKHAQGRELVGAFERRIAI